MARDKAAQIFDGVTDGAKAAAQLKALGGALVSKMPKMSYPQSDKDVLLYKEMARQIGDPTVPAELKKAAMQTIGEINQRYPYCPGTYIGRDVQYAGTNRNSDS